MTFKNVLEKIAFSLLVQGFIFDVLFPILGSNSYVFTKYAPTITVFKISESNLIILIFFFCNTVSSQ